jgi:hypothetical protein
LRFVHVFLAAIDGVRLSAASRSIRIAENTAEFGAKKLPFCERFSPKAADLLACYV